MSIRSLFCNHKYKVLSEHTETYQEQMYNQTRVHTPGSISTTISRPLTDLSGNPITRERTDKVVLLSCEKCGKTLKRTL